MECAERERLHAELSQALRAVVEIHGSQIAALQLGDTRTSHFEEEILIAVDAWQGARRAYIRHCTEHGCCENGILPNEIGGR
jgi:hypothetical protein